MIIITDRGTKYTCSSCAARFYDLGKLPAICPKCQHQVVILAPAAPRRRRRVEQSLILEKDPLAPIAQLKS